MKPNKIDTAQYNLFMNRLSNQLNPNDPLFIMASEVDWSFFEEAFSSPYSDGPGQPPKPVRLMVGLMLLQHMHGLSDEQVAYQWVLKPVLAVLWL
jgi:IS5 family transposase